MSAAKPFDPMSIKPILLDAALLIDDKEATKRLKTSKEDPFRWAEVLNSPFRLKDSRLEFDGTGTEVKLSGCTKLIEFAVLSEVFEVRMPVNKSKGKAQKKLYWSVKGHRKEKDRIPFLQLLVERGANPHPGIKMAKEAGYGTVVKFLEEASIHPDYGWDTLEAMRRIYAEVGKPKTNAEIKESLVEASRAPHPTKANKANKANKGHTTRKSSGSNSNNSKSSSKSSSKSKSNSKNSKSKKTPRGGAGGED